MLGCRLALLRVLSHFIGVPPRWIVITALWFDQIEKKGGAGGATSINE